MYFKRKIRKTLSTCSHNSPQVPKLDFNGTRPVIGTGHVGRGECLAIRREGDRVNTRFVMCFKARHLLAGRSVPKCHASIAVRRSQNPTIGRKSQPRLERTAAEKNLPLVQPATPQVRT